MVRSFSSVAAFAFLASTSLAAELRPTNVAISAEAAVLPPPAAATPAAAPSRDDPALRLMIEGEELPASPSVPLVGRTRSAGPLTLEVPELQQVNALCARAPNWQQFTICHRVRAYKAAAAPAASGPGAAAEQY